MTKTKVCVTGGSGFLGSWCVKTLLSEPDKYDVVTTVRTESKAKFLRSLPNADTNLTIIPNVELTGESAKGKFEEVFEGCYAVLHTASPYYFEMEIEDRVVRPAVEGTRNVLDACAAEGSTVKRVIITSSTAAVFANFSTYPEDHVYDEKDWSPEDLLRSKKQFYALSKTLGEKAAWDMSKIEGCPYTLTCINPTVILGPLLPGLSYINTSALPVLKYFDGSMSKIENLCKAVVDVRDVAQAHVNAIFAKEADGKRFMMIGACPHMKEVAEIVRGADDILSDEMRANVPTEMGEVAAPMMGQRPPNKILYTCEASEKVLGIKYRDLNEMVTSLMKSLMENGYTSSGEYSTATMGSSDPKQ
uniref:3-beta hydroxysteroid dehydrogenase/isomerase domain-containing protein n=1 Tax=Ditylum brightwellii TaxID=49249 RepID=A0A7S4SW69_9STRA|mmetsp:Transcript_6021/g.7841  ORF Transcript_6021/g.7841 Transcript_6021/m.7841 type:complete len:360 (+) Transcript_6021:100-1179(+)